MMTICQMVTVTELWSNMLTTKVAALTYIAPHSQSSYTTTHMYATIVHLLHSDLVVKNVS